MVRVDRYIGIGQKDLEPDPALAHIVKRFDEGARRREVLALELSIDPLEEELDERFAVGQSVKLLRFRGELAIADLILDGVERLDLLQGFGSSVGLSGQGLEEAASCMTPAQGVLYTGLLGVSMVGGIAVGHEHRVDDRLNRERLTDEIGGAR